MNVSEGGAVFILNTQLVVGETVLEQLGIKSEHSFALFPNMNKSSAHEWTTREQQSLIISFLLFTKRYLLTKEHTIQ